MWFTKKEKGVGGSVVSKRHSRHVFGHTLVMLDKFDRYEGRSVFLNASVDAFVEMFDVIAPRTLPQRMGSRIRLKTGKLP
ncbi:hypothetical protein CEP68_13100 [Brevundimonas vesicularis]|uniref:Uncharacterized protein n=1 Tax=Brevundimonas vesicularis TaxID=41276 RepID=A0A1Z3UAN4_BREVE|nr:hypothetical protein CEP68_13100 [Brevundimonas vesicularis]